ncbi:MAG: TolC family protein [Planctomycetaceae bacterium]|nr:TolC family protein [Planctomycetaceae bacterium]
MRRQQLLAAMFVLMVGGCASGLNSQGIGTKLRAANQSPIAQDVQPYAPTITQPQDDGNSIVSEVIPVAYEVPMNVPAESANPEEILPGTSAGVLDLGQVIESVRRSYPLLEAAYSSRDIAYGDHIAAHGAFDTKLKGASENGPAGFYETYRNSIGAERPIYGGGELFAGYRIGRGEFQPWYLERQTDKGGEFKAGLAMPLVRNVDIDSRRAQLWRTAVGQELAEPEIRLQLLDFVRAASYAYWDWVAAGERYRIAASLLEIAEGRNDAIRRKVETGDTEPPVLQDNRRLIVSREAKLIDAERKLRQSAIKLSLFWRDDAGQPLVPEAKLLPVFAMPDAPDESARGADIQTALANRPELQALSLLRQQLEIDSAEAQNDLLPDVQAVVALSQDVGEAATSKRDKSEFEVEAGVFLEVPLQRRKARGKLTAIDGKLQQVAAKTRMTEDKIVADVRAVYAALTTAFRQIGWAHESAALADQLAEIERRKFDLGESDLLSVNLREQQAAEAQSTEVDAHYDYFAALADYQAILARE